MHYLHTIVTLSLSLASLTGLNAAPVPTELTPATPADSMTRRLVASYGGDELLALGKREIAQAVALSTFTDSSCSQGQSDQHQPDGHCLSLSAKSIKISWLASGCRGMFFFFFFQGVVFFFLGVSCSFPYPCGSPGGITVLNFVADLIWIRSSYWEMLGREPNYAF
jgi:hypothetical protein